MKRKIPDRWEEYEAVGKVVAGTRFIAFKVPLNPMLSRSLPPDVKRFLPEDLPNLIREQDRELGIVIDLTNTTRYYRKEDILNQEIEYQKIFTEGHFVPSWDVQTCFFKTVDDFLSANKDNDKVIGVHCTHGLNRTGYLICRYMIDQMNFKPDDAIKAFNEARGHDMERQNYLSDLRGEPISDVPVSDKDRRMERKRVAPANAEESAEAHHSESKLKCTTEKQRTSATDDSFPRNDQWSHGANRSHTGQNSHDYYGNGSHQSRNYHSNNRQSHHQYPQSYDQHNYYEEEYDSARQPLDYDQHGGYHSHQNNYASAGSRNPWSADQRGFDFTSNNFSNPSHFGGTSFQSRSGRPHQFRGQHDPRPQYAQHDCNDKASRKTNHKNSHHQHRDNKQWRGNNKSQE